MRIHLRPCSTAPVTPGLPSQLHPEPGFWQHAGAESDKEDTPFPASRLAQSQPGLDSLEGSPGLRALFRSTRNSVSRTPLVSAHSSSSCLDPSSPGKLTRQSAFQTPSGCSDTSDFFLTLRTDLPVTAPQKSYLEQLLLLCLAQVTPEISPVSSNSSPSPGVTARCLLTAQCYKSTVNVTYCLEHRTR